MKVFWFYNKRGSEDGKFFEWYRCFDEKQCILFYAHADRLGKPIPVFRDANQVVNAANRSGYLVNGRTDITFLAEDSLVGSYARLGRVYDRDDQKVGRWQDARKWSEELKESLLDGIANALLGAGEGPVGGNPGYTHVFSRGKDIIATLNREKLAFFPDPPKSMEPGKLAKLASRVLPGVIGKELGEVTPPYGWKLSVAPTAGNEDLLLYSALVHLENIRYSRQA